ncbi:transposase [Bradyrhizobium sp. 35]|nr:transposase [Bradyrhizobium sp. 35]
MIHFIISNRRRRSCAAGLRIRARLFSYVARKRVPANHPLRKVRELVRDVLSDLTRGLGRLYASEGRPSIPPEQLLSALLLQVFYGIRSERQLMEQRKHPVRLSITHKCLIHLREGSIEES